MFRRYNQVDARKCQIFNIKLNFLLDLDKNFNEKVYKNFDIGLIGLYFIIGETLKINENRQSFRNFVNNQVSLAKFDINKCGTNKISSQSCYEKFSSQVNKSDELVKCDAESIAPYHDSDKAIFYGNIEKKIAVGLNNMFGLLKMNENFPHVNVMIQVSKVNFVKTNCGITKRTQNFHKQSHEKSQDSDEYLICDVELNVSWIKIIYAYMAIFNDNTGKIVHDVENVFDFLKNSQTCQFNSIYKNSEMKLFENNFEAAGKLQKCWGYDSLYNSHLNLSDKYHTSTMNLFVKIRF